jgi:hypothetical protein
MARNILGRFSEPPLEAAGKLGNMTSISDIRCGAQAIAGQRARAGCIVTTAALTSTVLAIIENGR